VHVQLPANAEDGSIEVSNDGSLHLTSVEGRIITLNDVDVIAALREQTSLIQQLSNQLAQQSSINFNLRFHPTKALPIRSSSPTASSPSVALSGSILAMGAPPSVSLYTTAVAQGPLLLSTITSASSKFGTTVALSPSGVLVVGNPSDALGQVFVYDHYSNTSSPQVLNAFDRTQGDGVGYAIAISSNDVIVVGASQHDTDTHKKTGGVYVFGRSDSGFVQRQLIIAPYPATNMYFGVSVAINRGLIVVGAGGQTRDELVSAGAAYVFRLSSGNDSTFSYHSTLYPETPTLKAYFGRSVAVSNHGVIVVSAHSDNVDEVIDTGSIHVFSPNATGYYGPAEQLQVASQANKMLGTKVVLDDDIIVATTGIEAGTLYMFQKATNESGYVLKAKLTSAQLGDDVQIGSTVATDAGCLVVGTTLAGPAGDADTNGNANPADADADADAEANANDTANVTQIAGAFVWV
jgi:hypothetical protein